MVENEKQETKEWRISVKKLLSQSPISIYDLTKAINNNKMDISVYNKIKYYVKSLDNIVKRKVEGEKTGTKYIYSLTR